MPLSVCDPTRVVSVMFPGLGVSWQSNNSLCSRCLYAVLFPTTSHQKWFDAYVQLHWPELLRRTGAWFPGHPRRGLLVSSDELCVAIWSRRSCTHSLQGGACVSTSFATFDHDLEKPIHGRADDLADRVFDRRDDNQPSLNATIDQ